MTFMSSVALSSAQEVQKVLPMMADGAEGIVYNLPSTAVQMQAVATCTVTKPGIYAQYAEKYLGITDAPLEEKTEWEIKSVTLNPVVVKDTARWFRVTFASRTSLPTFYLTGDGFLWGINREPSTQADTVTEAPVASKDKKALSAVNVMSEELLKAGSRAKQAEIAARAIFRIRESRLNLLTGEVDNLPADGASFQLVLDNLEAQEAAYMEMFTGVSVVKEETHCITSLPNDAVKDQILFRFSTHYGFVDVDDLSGEPFRLSVSLLEDNRTKASSADDSDAKSRKKESPKGVAYCIPGKARVSLSSKGQVLAQGDWQMAQFGRVEYLPSTFFSNKKAPASALFSPQTGGLVYLQGE